MGGSVSEEHGDDGRWVCWLGEWSNFERSVPQRGAKLRSESRFLDRKAGRLLGQDGL
jgi:hypothetical protein